MQNGGLNYQDVLLIRLNGKQELVLLLCLGFMKSIQPLGGGGVPKLSPSGLMPGEIDRSQPNLVGSNSNFPSCFFWFSFTLFFGILQVYYPFCLFILFLSIGLRYPSSSFLYLLMPIFNVSFYYRPFFPP